MIKIIYTVYQLEECKKLVLKGDTASLRMAFVLLDNAAEILMYRRIKSELVFNDSFLKMHKSAKAELSPDKYEEWRKLSIPIVESKRVHLINRFFDEKTKFLSQEHKNISESVASVLRSLHKYRNELYHNDGVRRETIKATTILFFEIVCDLLVKLQPGSMSYCSLSPDKEERQEFFNRYKRAGSGHDMLKDNGLVVIKNLLKKGISIDCDALRTVLQQTLRDRINNTIEGIDFVMQDGFRLNTRQATLKVIQLMNSGVLVGPVDYKKYLKGFIPKFNMGDFIRWEKGIKRFDRLKSKIKLFKHFCRIETHFEELESIVGQAAMDLDAAIQNQIDIMRGK